MSEEGYEDINDLITTNVVVLIRKQLQVKKRNIPRELLVYCFNIHCMQNNGENDY